MKDEATLMLEGRLRTACKRSLGQGKVSQVFVCPLGGGVPLGPGGCTPPDTPHLDTPQTPHSQQSGGTHITGMLSCYHWSVIPVGIYFNEYVNKDPKYLFGMQTDLRLWWAVLVMHWIWPNDLSKALYWCKDVCMKTIYLNRSKSILIHT